jgi:hypothetical protein
VSYLVTELRGRLRRESGSTTSRQPDAANLVVHRHELTIVHHRLRPAPFAMLEALVRDATSSEACEGACAVGSEATREVGSDVATWFANWVSRGFIVGIDRSDRELWRAGPQQR